MKSLFSPPEKARCSIARDVELSATIACELSPTELCDIARDTLLLQVLIPYELTELVTSDAMSTFRPSQLDMEIGKASYSHSTCQ